jgi:hypothetical protein
MYNIKSAEELFMEREVRDRNCQIPPLNIQWIFHQRINNVQMNCYKRPECCHALVTRHRVITHVITTLSLIYTLYNSL